MTQGLSANYRPISGDKRPNTSICDQLLRFPSQNSAFVKLNDEACRNGVGMERPGFFARYPFRRSPASLIHRRLFGRTAADRPGGYSSSSAEVSHSRISSAPSCVPDHRPNTGRASRARKPSAGQAPVAAPALNSHETEAWPSARAPRSRVRLEETTYETQSLMRHTSD